MRKALHRGKHGEFIAAEKYIQNGAKILETNFRFKHCEVDIIIQEGEEIVFAEVKSWSQYNRDGLEFSIDQRKCSNIIQVAKHFLQTNPEFLEKQVRFDVVFIKNGIIDIIKDAFSENDCYGQNSQTD